MPEDRRLALIISNDDPKSDGVESRDVMAQIFKVVEAGDTPKLNFSQCVPMAEFCGKMVVVCEDEVTLNWLTCVINMMCRPHSAMRFIKYFELVPATTVIPSTDFREDSCSVFMFIEQQNEGVLTHKWVLMKRYCLDPCTGAGPTPVQEVFSNEVFELYIDEESRERIESTCSKLKYQFWTIEFTFKC
ncbi:hypothetical protein KR032_000092 [Drosophila birchii]|nr:hypothetical protein KR032_000092 [Drosophila birchii]